MNILQSHTEQIKNLCRRHSVEKLYAFGSAVNDNFSAGSDIDLVVRFKEMSVDNLYLIRKRSSVFRLVYFLTHFFKFLFYEIYYPYTAIT